MPRRSASTAADDEYLSSDENDDSDREDYIVGFAGMTKGSKRADFEVPIQTTIFQHAIRNGYCSKQPPTLAQFLHLVEEVKMPKHGLRASYKLLKSLASWITNNVSAHKLVGLMIENSVGKVSTMVVYEVHISKALVQAVEHPAFTYTDILTLQNPGNPIYLEHTRLSRAMAVFAPTAPRDSMNKVVEQAMSHLSAKGEIVPSKYAKQARGISLPPPSAPYAYGPPAPLGAALGAAPGPSYTTTPGGYTPYAAWTQAPGPSPTQAVLGGSQPSGPSPGAYRYGPAVPLYPADQVRANQNRAAYKEWYDYVVPQVVQAAASGQQWSREIDKDWAFNGRKKDFCEEFDYVGWLLDHLRTSPQQGS